MSSVPAAEPSPSPSPGAVAERRRPGRPAKISRDMIVEAASSLPPETVTLQAVAERLGVDRKAVSYHVAGRDELISLVASRQLVSDLVGLDLPLDDWPEAVRLCATALRRALLRTGAMTLFITHLPGSSVLAPTEALLETLVHAGFDEPTAGHALALVWEVVLAEARDILLARQHGQHPTDAEVERILAELPTDQFPLLRRLMGSLPRPGGSQTTFDLEIVIAGLQVRLEQQPG